MGSTVNVHCPGCGYKGIEQMWGIGMLMEWEFFEHRLFCCHRCESLQSGYVIRKLPQLRAIAELPPDSTDWPGPFELTRQQLAKLMVSARERPSCSDCGGRLRGRSLSDASEHSPCPNCGEKLVFEAGMTLWD